MHQLNNYCIRLNAKKSLSLGVIQAAKAERDAIIAVLIQNGASLQYSDNNEKTALMWACMQGSRNTAKLLIQLKADVNACDRAGRTALSLAKDLEQISIVDILTGKEKGLEEEAHDVREAANKNDSDDRNKGDVKKRYLAHEDEEEPELAEERDDELENYVENILATDNKYKKRGASQGARKKAGGRRQKNVGTTGGKRASGSAAASLSDGGRGRKKGADRSEAAAPDVPTLLTRAGLAPGVRNVIMEEGYDELDWYRSANTRDWDRMIKATGITVAVKARILEKL
eukprot:CAMPEP_0184504550 /NCGR_PEP_ID=MMETSP0113_2-20130426/52525_1 /TAXON_ID=91329 /ORGANISM="Norrisiella sphaerica, Strain BC52" /LENGTH=285 /DNA_ID=CAMNT_0026894201 /DNA_START=474 /DNA_END=1331 /DNA_ORIENTATION=+